MFTKAIVKTPCKAMVDSLSSANLGKPDYPNALLQHTDYIEALKDCGLQVTILQAKAKTYMDASPESSVISGFLGLNQGAWGE